MMIFSLVAMTGLKCCITSACLQWLCHSGERPVARGPLVVFPRYISYMYIDYIALDKRGYQGNFFFFFLHENISFGYSLVEIRKKYLIWSKDGRKHKLIFFFELLLENKEIFVTFYDLCTLL